MTRRAPCDHRHQRVVASADGSRRQLCTSCGAVVATLPKLSTDDQRREQMLREGWPFAPGSPVAPRSTPAGTS